VEKCVLQGLTKLLELQRVDDELVALQTDYDGLPGHRLRIEAERSACDEQLAAAKQAVQDAEGGMRQAEGDLQDQEALLQKLESQQFQVKSNDAYTALLREMDHAREAISEHETKILEHMDAIEQSRGRLADAEKHVSETHSRLEAERRAIEARDEECTREIGRLQTLRSEVRPDVERELLAHYERVAKRRRPSVILVKEERCGGCRVGIPPQSFIEILRAESIVTCGNCSRILIHADKLELPAGS
jgi:predicted  nucleic acid-binding Zn-ribbon protein